MKHIYLALIGLLILSCSAIATPPYPPKVFDSDNFHIAIGFAWPDQDNKVFIIRAPRKTFTFSHEELGMEPFPDMTTAGSGWYQNAIGYFISIQTSTNGEYKHVFYLRDSRGKETFIDLGNYKRLTLANIIDRARLNDRTAMKAARLLQSTDPFDRQTGAIHLGQLKAGRYLRDLEKLVGDQAYFTQISNNETKTVFFVAEAAKAAIEKIKQGTASQDQKPAR